jgi:hypothetical protein
MPLSPTSRGQQQTSGRPQMQINHAYALVILIALAVLIAMRHLFGSIRVEVGAH